MPPLPEHPVTPRPDRREFLAVPPAPPRGEVPVPLRELADRLTGSGEVELVDLLGPPEDPHTLVIRTTPSRAESLRTAGWHVEENQELDLLPGADPFDPLGSGGPKP